jgi:predicted regulator of Ras-like GTPase activity (Roadblock/LC7/MglB family)
MGSVKELLTDINAVAGVKGSFVCDAEGSVVVENLPSSFETQAVHRAARTLLQTVDGLETTRRRRVHQLDIVFRDSRLVVKNLRTGCLYIVCTRNINVPLLDLTANLAARKMSQMLKEAKQRPERPAAVPSPEPEEAAAAEQELPGDLTSLLVERGRELIEAAARRAVLVRLLGGVAVKATCPSAAEITMPLETHDLDLAAYGQQRKQLDEVVETLGYEPHERFNALHGHRRLKYAQPEGGISLDVFVDTFHMCHRLPFANRLELSVLSIPPADLLLSKLQIVQMGEKDLRDIYALLCDHDLGRSDTPDAVDASYIASVCGDDWGWYKTVTMNIDKSMELADEFLSSGQREIFESRARRLKGAIEAAPKSLRWQARATIGEARRWYDLPEE